MNKKKLSLSFIVSLIVWTGVFVLFNLIIALFNLRSVLDNWNIIFDFVTSNLYWSMPSSSALAVISFIVNYYSVSLNKIKQWFDNFFGETKNQNNKLFLVDQRQNNASLSQFKKVVEHNSEKPGIVLYWNKQNKKYNWYTLPELHARVLGTTGSFKTQFFVLGNIYRNFCDPNLKERPNMLIIDPKGELYENAVHFNQKEQHYQLLQLDFTNPEISDSWNPLMQIWKCFYSDDPKRRIETTEKIQDFVKSIPQLDERNQMQKIWPLGASDYLMAILQFMLEYSKFDAKFQKQHFNIINMNRLAASIDDFEKILNWWAEKVDENGNLVSHKMKKIRENISYVLDVADETRNSFFASLKSAINQYQSNENLWKILCDQGLDFNYLLSDNAQQPFAFFITYPDEKLAVFPFVTLAISQFYQAAIETARENKKKNKSEKLNRCLQMFIDEFGVLPQINNFDNWINIARSRNIQITVAYQSEEQLNVTYGKAKEVIEDGFSASLLLASANLATAEKFSKMVGITHRDYESKSYSKKDQNSEISRSVSKQSERIISAEEIQQLHKTKYLLLLNNQKASILNKSLVFQEMKQVLDQEVSINRKKSGHFNPEKIIFDFFDIHKTIINDSVPNTKLNYDQEEWTW